MKNYFLFFLFGILFTSLVFAQTHIESAEISFMFVSKDVEGTVGGFDSRSSINLENLSESKFKGSVAVETIKTGNFLRDWTLKKSKYFNEETHPKISFESTEITEQDGEIMVKGRLQMKGTTKNISIMFKRKGSQFFGTTSLYSSDYDINIKSKREDNLVKIDMVLNLSN